MSSPPHPRGGTGTAARRLDSDSVPDVELELPADRRAAFRARGEIHRLLCDVHPQGRANAARLVGALLDAPITAATASQPIELRLWRSSTLLKVQVRSATRLSITDESRLLLDRRAEHWKLDHGGRVLRFDVRPDARTDDA
jgi:hypothetical protein